MAIAAALRRNPSRTLPVLWQTRLLSTQQNLNPNPNPNLNNPKPLTAVRSAIKSSSDPEHIADLFESSSHLPRFRSDRQLFSLTVHKLFRLRRPDLIHRLLLSQSQSQSQSQSPISEGFLTRLLTLYSTSSMLDHATQLFNQIPNPTNLSFTALLSSFLRHRRYDSLIDAFTNLPPRLSLSPSLPSHNFYLKALSFKGDLEAARSHLGQIPDPDISTYNTLLQGFLNKGDEHGFQEIFDEIQKRGLDPNVFTYNCRMSMLCKKSMTFMAEELLDVMLAKGLHPDLMSSNTVISGFCNEGELGSAVRVYRRLRKVGVLPSSKTYAMLIRGLVKRGELILGLEICKECLARKFVPSFGVVKELIEGLVKDEKVEEARGVVEKMRSMVKGEAIESWRKLEGELAL